MIGSAGCRVVPIPEERTSPSSTSIHFTLYFSPFAISPIRTHTLISTLIIARLMMMRRCKNRLSTHNTRFSSTTVVDGIRFSNYHPAFSDTLRTTNLKKTGCCVLRVTLWTGEYAAFPVSPQARPRPPLSEVHGRTHTHSAHAEPVYSLFSFFALFCFGWLCFALFRFLLPPRAKTPR